MIRRIAALAAVALMGFATPASAVLTIDIFGVPGDNVTIWDFDDSAVAGGNGDFSANTNFNSDELFFNAGTFTALDLFDIPEDGGSIAGFATITVGSETRLIDSVYVDGDPGIGNDEIAVGVSGTSDLLFAPGDTVIFDGRLFVRGIDITDLALGGLPNTLFTDNFGQNPGTLALEVTIRAVESIPLPPGIALMLGSLLVMGYVARRRV